MQEQGIADGSPRGQGGLRGALSRGGNRHNHDVLLILVAGKGGGRIRTGRHVRYARETPLNNLWLALLDRMNSRVDHLGVAAGGCGGWTGEKTRADRDLRVAPSTHLLHCQSRVCRIGEAVAFEDSPN